MPSASTTRPFAGSAAIESSLCERTIPGSVHVAISRFWLRSISASSRSLSRNADPNRPLPAYPWAALLQPNARRVNDLAEHGARSDGAGRKQLSRRHFLAVAQLRAQHFDPPA